MSLASTASSETLQDIMVEAMVKRVIAEMAVKSTKNRTGKSIATEETAPSSETKTRRKNKKSSKGKKKVLSEEVESLLHSENGKMKKKSKSKGKGKARTKVLKQLLDVLESLKIEESAPIPPVVMVKDDIDNSTHSIDLSCIDSVVGSEAFYHNIFHKLGPNRRSSLCIQDASVDTFSDDTEENNSDNDLDFEAAFGPNDMRCLALVSHNGMKATMKDFVIQNKHVLKKFRLTGTNSTMTMLAEVFADEPEIVFGPSCKSGPLGGDAELVALMTSGKLGGILFFQDPMSSHPHQCDIECLVRQAIVHNTLMANTPTTAMSLIEVFKIALMGKGKAQIIPSFFFDLESPTVQSYKNKQASVIKSHA